MNWKETHRIKPYNDDDGDNADEDYDDRDRLHYDVILLLLKLFYLPLFYGLNIIELKKIMLKCNLAILQTEADVIVVKTTSSLGRQGKDRGDSI